MGRASCRIPGEFIDLKELSAVATVNGDIPILVGGDTDAAIRRAVKLADGYFPGEGDTQQLAALGELERLVTRRPNYGTLEVNAMFGSQMADPEQGIADLRDMGLEDHAAAFFAGGEYERF